MKRNPGLFALLIFVAVGLLTLIAGVECSFWVEDLTNSGLLGICGPYGQHADLVGCLFLGSFPAAIVAGVFSARFFMRRVRDEQRVDAAPEAAPIPDMGR
jgi:hypothetical protein